MKLYEIPNYLNVKVRRRGWQSKHYVCFDNKKLVWFDNLNNVACSVIGHNFMVDDWEVFSEIKNPIIEDIKRDMNKIRVQISSLEDKLNQLEYKLNSWK